MGYASLVHCVNLLTKGRCKPKHTQNKQGGSPIIKKTLKGRGMGGEIFSASKSKLYQGQQALPLVSKLYLGQQALPLVSNLFEEVGVN